MPNENVNGFSFTFFFGFRGKSVYRKVVRTLPGNNAAIGKALKKLLKSKPSQNDLEAAGDSGGKIRTNNDVIALALFKRAAKGEVTAIRELRDIVSQEADDSSAKLSKLYDALQQDEPID